jgi:hypothetical protein
LCPSLKQVEIPSDFTLEAGPSEKYSQTAHPVVGKQRAEMDFNFFEVESRYYFEQVAVFNLHVALR